MTRILIVFVMLTQFARAASYLGWNPDTSVLNLQTIVGSTPGPGPWVWDDAEWSGTVYLRVTGLREIYPVDPRSLFFLTIPATLSAFASDPRHADGTACVNSFCSSDYLANVYPTWSFFLYAFDDPVALNIWRLRTTASAIYNDRGMYPTSARASVAVDFGHPMLVQDWTGRDLTNLVTFDVVGIAPPIPSPEPGAVWLAASALIASVAARRLYSKHG